MIYEIQTGSLSPLKNKIDWILQNTSYNLTVIHPIAKSVWISYIDPKSGSIGQRRKSSRHGRLEDIASELYFIRDFVSSPRFSLVLLFIEADSYRTITSKGKRVRSSKYEMIPHSLLDAKIFASPENGADAGK